MFDFHMHSRVSFDSEADPREMVRAAEAAGLKEICFTDHMDYDPKGIWKVVTFTEEEYAEAYDALESDTVKIRKGFEFGMLPSTAETLKQVSARRDYDFVIGSVHFAKLEDIYEAPFWEGKTVWQAERDYFEDLLACVQTHDFDVLGHLTYPGKAKSHPNRRAIPFSEHREIVDEILKTLVARGKGMEINTSGMGSCGAYLPSLDYFLRFKELGGQIVTVGSDAHGPDRVGERTFEAVKLLGEIFGHVCTFENRKPIFHKI